MKNKKFLVFGFISTAFVISAFFSSTLFANPTVEEAKKMSRLQALEKFQRVLYEVEKNNVDDITVGELVDKALKGMLSNLDAHSNYLDKKSLKQLMVETKGEFGGLGISVGMKDGALTVIAPIEGTPADKAGLKAGDIILKIEDKSTLDMTLDEAVSLMRGEKGTPINITVFRKGKATPFKVHIIRDIIKIQSVYTKTIDKDILYIRVTSFNQKVVEDVTKAINKSKKTTKGIILDLRNNPGGLLSQAIGLVDIFVDSGNIVSQKGRHKKDDAYYDATKSATLTKVPLVVLVNGGSASASEIVSGALQDHKRAILVGEKTFGKGSVQSIIPVTQTEAIKLTIARYYLPSGRTIQAVGITPDIGVLPGEIKTQKNEFSIKEADLKKHLEKELEKVDGKKVEKKAKNEDKKDIITPQMMDKDIQLKEGVNILKALIITKGQN